MIATGEAHGRSRDFARSRVPAVGLDWREHVRYDESLGRGATDARALVGDATKAREQLGWRPEVGFDELVSMMVEADRVRLERSA